MFAEQYLITVSCPQCDNVMHIKYTKNGFEPLYVCENCNLAMWWDSPMVLKLKRDDSKKRHE